MFVPNVPFIFEDITHHSSISGILSSLCAQDNAVRSNSTGLVRAIDSAELATATMETSIVGCKASASRTWRTSFDFEFWLD